MPYVLPAHHHLPGAASGWSFQRRHLVQVGDRSYGQGPMSSWPRPFYFILFFEDIFESMHASSSSRVSISRPEIMTRANTESRLPN